MNLEAYRSSDFLPLEIEMKQDLKGIPKSPVYAFSEILIKDARDELKARNRGRIARTTLTEDHPSGERPKPLPTHQLEYNILLGLTLQTVEDTLVSGLFSEYTFVSKYNNIVGEYSGVKLPDADDNVIRVTSSGYNKLKEAATKDPSLAGIVADSEDVFPEFWSFLEKIRKTDPVLRLLQDYREIIEPFLTSHKVIGKSRKEQLEKITEFDDVRLKIGEDFEEHKRKMRPVPQLLLRQSST